MCSGRTFTTNIVKAAPVKWDQHVVYDSKGTGSVVNAGIANACTGEEGIGLLPKATTEKVNKLLQIPADGACGIDQVIGMQLPIDRICAELKRWSTVKWRYRADMIQHADYDDRYT